MSYTEALCWVGVKTKTGAAILFAGSNLPPLPNNASYLVRAVRVYISVLEGCVGVIIKGRRVGSYIITPVCADTKRTVVALIFMRVVVQLGRTLDFDSRGRRFKSYYPCHLKVNMFKRVNYGHRMPEYHPSGSLANRLLTTVAKLDIMEINDVQVLMLKQLRYWRIQT